MEAPLNSDLSVAVVAPGQRNEGAHCANVAATFPAAFRYVAARPGGRMRGAARIRYRSVLQV